MGLVQSLLRTSLPPAVTPSPEVVNIQTITPALEVPPEVTPEVVTTQTVTPTLEVPPEVTPEVVTTQTVTPALEVPPASEVVTTQTPAAEDITAATAQCNAEHPSTPKKGLEVSEPISPPPLQRKINLTVAMSPVNFTLNRSEEPLVMLDESHNLTMATATATAQQEPQASTSQVSTSQASHKKHKKNRG
jgi:hypothetical protein